MEKTVVTSTLFTLLNVHVESESVLTTIEYRRRKNLLQILLKLM